MARPAQVIIDEDGDDEDGDLLVDWKASSSSILASASASIAIATTTATTATRTLKSSCGLFSGGASVSNVLCLDSDSDGSAPIAVVLGTQTSSVDDPREIKRRKLEQEKEARKEERAARKQAKEAEKQRLKEEKRKKKEAERLQKARAKEKAAQVRTHEQQKAKWEKGTFSAENTVAIIDCKVAENGLIGGQLLNLFAGKELKFSLSSNPISGSIIWKTKRLAESFDTENDEIELEEVDVPYVLLVFGAEEFSSLLCQGSLDVHVRRVQAQYPGFTVCYLVNKLHWYLQKKDQEQFKRGESEWIRPNADKALAELVTNYCGVHSRLCIDEAEVADHVIALTRSLIECPYKQRLTSLSVSKNGDHIVDKDPNKEVIKKSSWLKTLVAIPKVSGAAAIAISKRYPSFRSLLNAYMDPSMTVHDKELLLQDLEKEGADSRRRVGPACSRRIYRILMAQNGDLKTEDVETGADQFDCE
ncbi:crossover junction endonuclease EME1 [Selaginella moellendorffii]|uniref:crossover junction endonuclease EME1 n=1 Tax=Selaginella moellendorffii TaxID=88036 RepID=UPI000D1C214B|nr:crossover junction endonuclease EME1 [Selaginella moellendorffii]|eukprot:XP_024519413.1 crossover junction endonuclease EME1 [Selaginella moellendorffii]